MSILLLNTDNTYLVFLDLLSDEKRALLARTDSGPRAIPRLEATAARLALIVQRGKPYADELAEADRRHDIGCAALNLICDLHELLAVLPDYAALAEAPRAVRATLSMDRALTRASYAEEAANAARNLPLLPRLEDPLRAMHLADGLSAYDVAKTFIRGGEDLRRWLARRAEAMAEVQIARAEAGGSNLLHEAREQLTRLRATLTGEASWRDDLPQNLVERIFSVLDERIAAALAAARSGRAAGEGSDASAPDPAEGDGAADPSADADAADPSADDRRGADAGRNGGGDEPPNGALPGDILPPLRPAADANAAGAADSADDSPPLVDLPDRLPIVSIPRPDAD